MSRDFLAREGVEIGRRHVATLMKRMGIEAIYRRRNTSKLPPGHKIYPYLLRGVKVERPNQVWPCEITYIPMARGFVYLVAIVDWATRRVLSHRVSITMDAAFCVEALEEAIGKYGKPEISANCFAFRDNTNQGRQFTSEAFTGVLHANGIAISMDGKGAWRDNHASCKSFGIRRAAMAKREIRGGLSQSLRHGRRSPLVAGPISRRLQPTASAFEP